jgi:hypothetical protein
MVIATILMPFAIYGLLNVKNSIARDEGNKDKERGNIPDQVAPAILSPPSITTPVEKQKYRPNKSRGYFNCLPWGLISLVTISIALAGLYVAKLYFSNNAAPSNCRVSLKEQVDDISLPSFSTTRNRPSEYAVIPTSLSIEACNNGSSRRNIFKKMFTFAQRRGIMSSDPSHNSVNVKSKFSTFTANILHNISRNIKEKLNSFVRKRKTTLLINLHILNLILTFVGGFNFALTSNWHYIFMFFPRNISPLSSISISLEI